ncbi:MAG: response regulator transcription factor [Roseiflexaceae bacterium]
MIRIVICDDQVIVCEGLQAIFETDPDLEVLGVAYDGLALLDLLQQVTPDLVLMDLKMPRMSGVAATRQIRELYPSIRVLVLTTYDAEEWVFDAIRAGAAGYLLKDTPRDQLIAAIKGTMDGETFVDPAVAGRLFAHIARHTPAGQANPNPLLTERERDILRLIARGQTNSAIASNLHLSDGTVRNYVSSLLLKLEAEDRTQAVIKALRIGLVSVDDLIRG